MANESTGFRFVVGGRSKLEKLLQQKWTVESEGMGGENVRPDRVFGVWRSNDDPEAGFWVMDDGDDLPI